MTPILAKRDSQVSVVLQEAALKQKKVLWRLLQLHSHDYSDYDLNEMSSEGEYAYRWFNAYWEEATRHPFLILVEGKISGFVFVRERDGAEDWEYQIAEFFILRGHRRKKIGRDAAHKALSLFPGIWEIGFDDNNFPAVNFWKSIASQYSKARLEPEPGRENRSRYLLTVDKEPVG